MSCSVLEHSIGESGIVTLASLLCYFAAMLLCYYVMLSFPHQNLWALLCPSFDLQIAATAIDPMLQSCYQSFQRVTNTYHFCVPQGFQMAWGGGSGRLKTHVFKVTLYFENAQHRLQYTVSLIISARQWELFLGFDVVQNIPVKRRLYWIFLGFLDAESWWTPYNLKPLRPF